MSLIRGLPLSTSTLQGGGKSWKRRLMRTGGRGWGVQAMGLQGQMPFLVTVVLYICWFRPLQTSTFHADLNQNLDDQNHKTCTKKLGLENG